MPKIKKVKRDHIAKTGFFAIKAHRGQRRENIAHPPYVSHSIKVAKILRNLLRKHNSKLLESERGRVIIKASLLHDVVEDTAITNTEIRK